MKQTQKMMKWLVVSCIALAMVTSLTAQTVKERTGQIVRLKGAARYSTGNNVWQPVKTGTILKSGYIIQTAADSYLDILLGEIGAVPKRVAVGDSSTYQPKVEQDVIRVREDSVLAFDKMTTMNTGADEVTDTQLDLRAGKIFGTVKKMSSASRYEIKLPNGVAGVRGTVYSISAVGIVQVFSGSVVVSWTGSDGSPMTQVVNAHQQFDVRTGLITPIPDFEERTAIHNHGELHFGHPPPPTSFVVDHTIYHVSPHDEDDQGEDNDDQGNNEQ